MPKPKEGGALTGDALLFYEKGKSKKTSSNKDRSVL